MRLQWALAATRRCSHGTKCHAAADAAAPGPLTEDQLRELSSREAELQEQALGDAWREQFSEDIEGLYDYISRCVVVQHAAERCITRLLDIASHAPPAAQLIAP